MSKKIVLASNNKKKMKEMQELLAPMGAEVISQGSLGIPSAEEPFGKCADESQMGGEAFRSSGHCR